MDIELTPVESSQIHAIGYDEAQRKLAVQFKGKTGPGSLYHYDNVPPELHQEFMAADSKGRFFKEKIKPATEQYPFTRIQPTAETAS